MCSKLGDLRAWTLDEVTINNNFLDDKDNDDAVPSAADVGEQATRPQYREVRS